MPKEIKEKPASFCPANCPHACLSLNTESAYALNSVAVAFTVLSCEHEDACKMWAESASKNVPVMNEARWMLWGGWRGNHDQRIEDATCSFCGFRHPTVYGSISKLAQVCPSCKASMTSVLER